MSTTEAEAGVDEEIPTRSVAARRIGTAPQVMPAPQAMATPLRPVGASLAPAAGPATSTALDRIRETSQGLVAQAAYQLRRLGTGSLAGIVAVVAAATIFLAYNLPHGAAVSELQAQLAHAPIVAVTMATANSATLASLPPRGEAPDVVAKVYEEAKAAGVELPKGQYEYIPPRDGVAARYRLTFPVHATYPQIRSFIDRTLIALPAVAVEGLRIERKAVGDGSVDAEVKLAAYVRGEP
jgi:hypothetical protein